MYDIKGRLYLKCLRPGMNLVVWHMGPKAYIYGINKNDTYKFIKKYTKYKKAINEYMYIIKNLNTNTSHELDAWEMIDLFNLSPEDPEKEEKKMIKLELKISDIKPGMIFRAVNPMVTLGIYSGNEYQIERVERDILTDGYRVRLYYAPKDSYYSITDRDFMFIFNVEVEENLCADIVSRRDLMGYTVVDASNPIFALPASVDIYNAAVRKRSGRYPWLPWSDHTIVTDLPKPKFIQINTKKNCYTAVWSDGTHTTVRLAEDDIYDEEKLFMILTFKKIFGKTTAMKKFFKENFADNIKEV